MTELVALGVVRKAVGYEATGEIGPDGEPKVRVIAHDIQPGETFTWGDAVEAAWFIRIGAAAPAGSEGAAFAIKRAQGRV